MLEVAGYLGMSLDDVLDKHTDRQLDVYAAHFMLELNRPDRHDYYLMQIANHLRKKPVTKLDSLKIPFVDANEPEQPMTEEDAELITAMSRARIDSWAGVNRRKQA